MRLWLGLWWGAAGGVCGGVVGGTADDDHHPCRGIARAVPAAVGHAPVATGIGGLHLCFRDAGNYFQFPNAHVPWSAGVGRGLLLLRPERPRPGRIIDVFRQ